MLSDYSQLSSDGDESSSCLEEEDEEILFRLSSGLDKEQVGDRKCVIINQYAQDVIDFSSQYGSDTSISYTAYNVTGKPSKYPDYGDFPESFAFRTYGPWWKRAPSSRTEFHQQDYYPIDDYLVVRFEEPVVPESIKVFETYNPGAIVRLWAYTLEGSWFCLWDQAQESPDENQPLETNKARVFLPKLNPAPGPTRYIRLEFNHKNLNYSTQLDAILMIGKKFVPSLSARIGLQKNREFIRKGEETFQEFLRSGYNGSSLESEEDSGSRSETPTRMDSFELELTLDKLPYDVLFKIMNFLDLKSLFRCGQVCSSFYCIVSASSLLYAEVNLKPYWNCSDGRLLQTLKKRCAYTKKLDLSWCGLFNKITAYDFKDFVSECGSTLTHLRLDSCKFLTTGNCLDILGTKCPNLRELSLQNYQPESPSFSGLFYLHNLERLDLTRTFIDTQSLLKILVNNPNLQHLNIAFCPLDVNMDDVAIQLGKTNLALVSLDMWKSHSLTSRGLQALSSCHLLEEVDFGWCLREEPSPGEAIRNFVKSCPHLKKLFLAAIRGLGDRDLEVISHCCRNLEQLDLMGIQGISTEMCYRILCQCRRLKLLDLSFCDNLDNLQIGLWRECFEVDIKRSLADFGPQRSEF
ncbi:F-box/LRR-repeat protein 4 [Uranotaenia lowii]|uniref:F-box/LRR-repeat protein 4 n=1 Tax=Uranotaenia lowii TaxID=190385 RepID=UPI00247943ED|nr:F-box/LRR-repeat protein 4 [Uranotaenia lowii]